MRKAARVIVVHGHNILVMKRNKRGAEYYCLVGGGIEAGETADQAVLREAHEETTLTLTDPQLVFIEDAGEQFGPQYIFLCQYKDGEVTLHPDSIEHRLNQNQEQGQNLFQPMWVPVSKFASLPFLSKTLQQEILMGLRDGFPKNPKMITSRAEISYTNNQQKEE